MSLAQVQSVVALFVGLIASYAGLLIGMALLMPAQTEVATNVLERSPKRCLLSGLGMLVLIVIALVLANVPNPAVKIVAFLALLGMSGMIVVGGAGLAHLMGKRIGEMSGAKTSFGTLVRGSIVYTLAMFFPFVGWWLFAPVSVIYALGAGAIALWPFRRSVPTTPSFEGQGAV